MDPGFHLYPNGALLKFLSGHPNNETDPKLTDTKFENQPFSYDDGSLFGTRSRGNVSNSPRNACVEHLYSLQNNSEFQLKNNQAIPNNHHIRPRNNLHLDPSSVCWKEGESTNELNSVGNEVTGDEVSMTFIASAHPRELPTKSQQQQLGNKREFSEVFSNNEQFPNIENMFSRSIKDVNLSSAFDAIVPESYDAKHSKGRSCDNKIPAIHDISDENVSSKKPPFECEQCGAKFAYRIGLRRHEKIHTGQKLFECSYCKAKFHSNHHLKRHLMTHTGEKPFACKYCDAKFATTSHVKTHERTHTGEKPFACQHCDLKFANAYNVKRHETVHTGERPFGCRFCSARFRSSSNLAKHKKRHIREASSHHPKRSNKFLDIEPSSNDRLVKQGPLHFPNDLLSIDGEGIKEVDADFANLTGPSNQRCSGMKCETKLIEAQVTELEKLQNIDNTYSNPFNIINSLAGTISSDAGASGAYFCRVNASSNIQQSDGTSQNDFSIIDFGHQKVTHSEPESSGLENCGAKVTFCSSENHDKNDSTKRPYQCNQCGARFAHRDRLKYHERIHTGDKPFACKQCDARFYSNSALIRHGRVHTGERPFACNYCDSKFATACQLQYHERVHSGYKPFSCKLCSATFRSNGDLKRHEKGHSGETPYECQYCSAKFASAYYLGCHEKIHTEERSFGCKYCDDKFTTVPSLKLHERIHTLERSFECEQCSAKFFHKEHLAFHEKTHSGEKSFVCRYCSAVYLSKSGLRNHEKEHNATKSFGCLFCGAKFVDKFNAKKHMKIHTELSSQENRERFQCQYCDAKYLTKSGLKFHEKKHTAGKSYES